MGKPMYRIAKLIMIAGFATGCASNDPYRNTKTGAAAGAALGAVLGHQLDDDSGRYYGAVAGALAGAGLGNYMDRQQQAMEEALAAERQQHAVEIERLRDGSLKMSLDGEVSFDFDRAEIKPAFEPSLSRLAEVLKQYDRTTVRVVGHTDNAGSEAYNQDLSERRARAVGDFLAGRGVSSTRISTEGRGESEPRDTNATAAGRQLNRRVEVLITPVEGTAGRSRPVSTSPPA